MAEHRVDTLEAATQCVSGIVAHPRERIWLSDGNEPTIGADAFGRIDALGT